MENASISTALGEEVQVPVWSVAQQEKKHPKSAFCGLKVMAIAWVYFILNSLPAAC